MDLSQLNEPQRQAVTHASGPLLVLAGAGSGKTRVITYRIAHLLDNGVDPRHICALTFTNKAAQEMRARIAALLGDRNCAQSLAMGTFHSLGLSMLRSERAALDLPRGFAVYDQSDQLGVVREIMRRISLGDRRLDAAAILARISHAKNSFATPDEVTSGACDEYDTLAAEVFPKYQEALRAFGALDFDDLVCEAVRLIETHAQAGPRWRQAFRYVLVDEYQDTNRAQVRLVKALVCDHHNVCAVGDDDQSIYSWRGADARGILAFERDFPEATLVKLEQNYRSTSTILAAANAVIANNRERYGKVLFCEGNTGSAIVTVVAPDSDSEARFVAREIERLHKDDGVPLSHCAVLYRSNKQAPVLEAQLRELQIAYTMVGGQQFFERKEVKDVIAYVRLALNLRDEISLRRIINSPSRGVGPTTVDRLLQFAKREHISLWDALRRRNEVTDLGCGQRRAVESFVDIITALDSGLTDGVAVVGSIRAMIEAVDWYGDLRSAAPSFSAAQRRIDNIERLLRSIDEQQRRSPGRTSLAEFLRKLSLDNGVDDRDDEERGQRVLLTTLHGSKGLEFPVVFLVGLEEELLPHARTLSPQVTDRGGSESARDVDEERRLAYVGITRARNWLYLSRAKARWVRGKQVLRVPSRFLLEVPDDLVEERDIASEAAMPVEAAELSAFFGSFLSDTGVARK